MTVISKPGQLMARPTVEPSLPELRCRLVGRSEIISAIKLSVGRHRIVSIVGPGGIGKTSVAIAAAHELAPSVRDGVCFVDLTRHATAGAMTQQLAVALGLDASPGDITPALLKELRGRQLLIVLDCCEVALDAATALAEAVVMASTQVAVLATSREALDARDEQVHRIEPLGCPPEALRPAWLLSRYPAMQLFAHVAAEAGKEFRFNDEEAAVASAICRRLDGNPLAITLAASHVPSMGLGGVADQIDGAVLDWRASPDVHGQVRHQSLEAVLDWSFHRLSLEERRVFCSLSTFRSHFDLDAAVAVGGRTSSGSTSVVLSLLSKSLLDLHNVGGEVSYRLLDTTRSYAERALAQMPPVEVTACRQRHATFLVRLLHAAELQWELMSPDAWRRKYGAWIDDVCAALQWSFSDGGDVETGVNLTVAAMALADQTNRIVDYANYAQRALAELQMMSPRKPEMEMRLHAAPVLRQMCEPISQVKFLATLTKARELGRAIGSVQTQLGCLLALWSRAFQSGNYHEAVERTAKIQELADVHRDPVADLTAMRTRAQNLHFLGDHAGAYALALRVCAHGEAKLPLAYMPSPVSMSVSMRILRVRILWLQGRSEQAWKLSEECLRLAEEDHPMSICQAWAMARLPLALWCGRRDEAARGIAELKQVAQRFDYPYWATWSRVLGSALGAAPSPLSSAHIREVRAPDQVLLRDHLVTLQAGPSARESFERVQRGEVGWSAPEAMRVHAELLWAQSGASAVAQVRKLLQQSIRLAQAHGALTWELRTAMSMYRLDREAGGDASARRRLSSIRWRLVEDRGSPDLREADRLLGY